MGIEADGTGLGVDVAQGYIVNGSVNGAAVFAVKPHQRQLGLQGGDFRVIIGHGVFVFDIFRPQIFHPVDFINDIAVKLLAGLFMIKLIIVIESFFADGYLNPAVFVNYKFLNVVDAGFRSAVNDDPRIVVDRSVERFVFQRKQLVIRVFGRRKAVGNRNSHVRGQIDVAAAFYNRAGIDIDQVVHDNRCFNFRIGERQRGVVPQINAGMQRIVAAVVFISLAGVNVKVAVGHGTGTVGKVDRIVGRRPHRRAAHRHSGGAISVDVNFRIEVGIRVGRQDQVVDRGNAAF